MADTSQSIDVHVWQLSRVHLSSPHYLLSCSTRIHIHNSKARFLTPAWPFSSTPKAKQIKSTTHESRWQSALVLRKTSELSERPGWPEAVMSHYHSAFHKDLRAIANSQDWQSLPPLALGRKLHCAAQARRLRFVFFFGRAWKPFGKVKEAAEGLHRTSLPAKVLGVS